MPDVTTLRSPLLRLTKVSVCPRHMAGLLGIDHNATVLHVYSTYDGITNRRSQQSHVLIYESHSYCLFITNAPLMSRCRTNEMLGIHTCSSNRCFHGLMRAKQVTYWLASHILSTVATRKNLLSECKGVSNSNLVVY